MSELIERLRTDAAYANERVGVTIRQIGRDCHEAADALEAKDKLIAELSLALKSARVDVFNWLDEIYKFETETGAGEHPRLDAIDALLLRAKNRNRE